MASGSRGGNDLTQQGGAGAGGEKRQPPTGGSEAGRGEISPPAPKRPCLFVGVKDVMDPTYQNVDDAKDLRRRCKTNKCQRLRTLIYVNDRRKVIVCVHANQEGRTVHIIIQTISMEDGSVTTDYVELEGRPDYEEIIIGAWYNTFHSDTSGVLYDSQEKLIYGVPIGHPGSQIPRFLGDVPTVEPPQPVIPTERKKYSIAEQRERVPKLTKKDLENYFCFQLRLAAEYLDLSLTVLKGLRMRNNLARWPYRSINAIDNKINKWMKSAIMGPNLRKAINGVTRAFTIQKEKEQFYEKLLGEMPKELQGKDEVIRELEEAAAAGITHLVEENEQEEEEEDMEEGT